MAGFNTGTTATATNVPQSTHPTLTIPAGVLVADTMYVCVSMFTYTPTNADITLTSTAGSVWTNIGGGIQSSPVLGGLQQFGKLWTRKATAADPGDVLTFAFTGTPGATNAQWWTIDIVSYTGFTGTDVVPIPNTGTGNSTSNTTPAGATGAAGDWAIYFGSIAVANSGTISTAPSGTTMRENNGTSGICCAIADSNGSVGGSGTSIGGNHFTTNNGGGTDQWVMFTVALSPLVITLVGQAGIAGGSAASPVTITYSSAARNTLIITGHLFDNNSGAFVAPTSITDSTNGANIWMVSTNSAQSALTVQNPPLESLTDPSDGGAAHQADWVAWCIGAQAVTSVTIAWEGGVSTWRRINLSEFSGIVQFDNSWAGGSTSSVSSVTSGPVMVNVPGELVVGALDFGGGGTQSVPTGWTQFTGAGSVGDQAYIIGPATGSLSPVWTDTVANSWVGSLAVFSPVPLWAPQSARNSMRLSAIGAVWRPVLRRRLTNPTGTAFNTAAGSGALQAYAVMSIAATAGPDLAALWAAYLAAAANSAKLVDYWRQLHSSSRTDGTVGQIYAQLYTADQAKDAAYKAWEVAWRRINSQAPPSGPAT